MNSDISDALHELGKALAQRLEKIELAIRDDRNAALHEAAAIARANTSAPRIWQDGAWFNPHGEDIALKIEALIK